MAKQTRRSKSKPNEKLREAISKLGSQYDAAEILGTQQSRICDYINRKCGKGPMPPHMVLKLCVLCDLNYMPEHLVPEVDWSWLYEFISMFNKHQNDNK